MSQMDNIALTQPTQDLDLDAMLLPPTQEVNPGTPPMSPTQKTKTPPVFTTFVIEEAQRDPDPDEDNHRKLFDELEGDKIPFMIMDDRGHCVFFKMLKEAPFTDVFEHYCDHKNLERRTVNFKLNGQTVLDSDTPLTMHMEDDDVMDCLKISSHENQQNKEIPIPSTSSPSDDEEPHVKKQRTKAPTLDFQAIFRVFSF